MDKKSYIEKSYNSKASAHEYTDEYIYEVCNDERLEDSNYDCIDIKNESEENTEDYNEKYKINPKETISIDRQKNEDELNRIYERFQNDIKTPNIRKEFSVLFDIFSKDIIYIIENYTEPYPIICKYEKQYFMLIPIDKFREMRTKIENIPHHSTNKSYYCENFSRLCCIDNVDKSMMIVGYSYNRYGEQSVYIYVIKKSLFEVIISDNTLHNNYDPILYTDRWHKALCANESKSYENVLRYCKSYIKNKH
jgi:hypothetical protein